MKSKVFHYIASYSRIGGKQVRKPHSLNIFIENIFIEHNFYEKDLEKMYKWDEVVDKEIEKCLREQEVVVENEN